MDKPPDPLVRAMRWGKARHDAELPGPEGDAARAEVQRVRDATQHAADGVGDGLAEAAGWLEVRAALDALNARAEAFEAKQVRADAALAAELESQDEALLADLDYEKRARALTELQRALAADDVDPARRVAQGVGRLGALRGYAAIERGARSRDWYAAQIDDARVLLDAALAHRARVEPDARPLPTDTWAVAEEVVQMHFEGARERGASTARYRRARVRVRRKRRSPVPRHVRREHRARRRRDRNRTASAGRDPPPRPGSPSVGRGHR